MVAVLDARDLTVKQLLKRDDLMFHPELVRDTFRLHMLLREAPHVRVPFMILEDDSIGQWSFITTNIRDTLNADGYSTLTATLSNKVVIEPAGFKIINSETKQVYDIYRRQIIVLDPDSLFTELPADFDFGNLENKPSGVLLEKESYS